MTRRAAARFAPALLTLLFVCCQGCRPGHSMSDPLDTPDVACGELRGIPSTTALPPAVPGAGGHISVANVTGPQKGRVIWNVALPFESMPALIQAIGADGTVYVSGHDGVGAVRDGKLQWAYKVDSPTQFGLADDGSLWFTKSGVGQYFVFNRDGQGGLMPYGLRRPVDSLDRSSSGCSGDMRGVRTSALRGDILLDYECTRPQAKTGPDGLIYVGTDAPDIRAYRSDKSLVWKVQAPCAAETLVAGPNGRVVFSCKDNSMHYIDHGVMKWSQPGDGEVQEPNIIRDDSSMAGVMDGQGTLYFVDRPASGVATHIHALSASGKMLWTVETGMFSPGAILFDKNGRLYMSGERGMAMRLVAFGD